MSGEPAAEQLQPIDRVPEVPPSTGGGLPVVVAGRPVLEPAAVPAAVPLLEPPLLVPVLLATPLLLPPEEVPVALPPEEVPVVPPPVLVPVGYWQTPFDTSQEVLLTE